MAGSVGLKGETKYEGVSNINQTGEVSEVGIGEEKFDEMASEAVRTSGLAERAYVKLDSSDVREILLKCL